MRLQWLRLELRMKLAAYEMRVIGQLDHLDVGAVWGRAGNSQSACRQRAFVFPVKLVAMSLALADFKLSINSVCQSARINLAGPGSQPHAPPSFFHALQSMVYVNYALSRSLVILSGRGVGDNGG